MIVESGNLSDDVGKLGLIASVLAELHYDAVGVGDNDLRVGGEEFFKQAAEHKLQVLDASYGARKSTLPYLVKNVGGVRVGVVSFGAAPAVPDQNEYVRRKALYWAYKAARSASDILVALDQASVITPDWLKRNGNRLGVPEVVIGGMQRGYVRQEAVDKPHIVPTYPQGKQVGVLDIEFTAGQEPKFTSQKIAVDLALPEDAAIAERVNDYVLKTGKTPVDVPNQTSGAAQAVPVGAKPYYAPFACRACHVKEYDDWAATKHASAIKTLMAKDRAIPECLVCHSEQFRALKQVSIPQDGIGGVDCATCHFGSLPHGTEHKNVTTRTKVDPKLCVECHTKDRSPDYEEKSYMAKVRRQSAAAAK